MYKVVLVDDEEIILQGLKKTVPWQEYNCVVAGVADNGKDGLELMRTLKPDILFTDIRMPGINGLEMIAELKNLHKPMEVIVLTGYREFEYALEALNLGVLRMIMKPTRIEDIVDALEAAIEAIGSPEEGEEPVAPIEEGPGSFLAGKALKYISEHYAEKITLEQVANELYVSMWHLCKVLKKTTNKNFIDIVNGTRIENAKKLLEDTHLRVYEISEAVGFSGITYFSRLFKKITGMTPTEYRNQVWSKKQ